MPKRIGCTRIDPTHGTSLSKLEDGRTDVPRWVYGALEIATQNVQIYPTALLPCSLRQQQSLPEQCIFPPPHLSANPTRRAARP